MFRHPMILLGMVVFSLVAASCSLSDPDSSGGDHDHGVESEIPAPEDMLDDTAREMILEEAERQREDLDPLSSPEIELLSSCAGADVVERIDDETAASRLSFDELDLLEGCLSETGLDSRVTVELAIDDVPGLTEHLLNLYNEESTSQAECLVEHGWPVSLVEADEEGYVVWELTEGDLSNESFIEDANRCAGS